MKKFLSLLMGSVGIVALFPLFAMAERYTPPPRSADVQCMQQAVSNRGNAFMDAFNVFHETVTRALKDRIVAETNAWGQSDAKMRERALHDAAQAFDKAYNTAAKTLDKQKNAARQQFESDSKACKTNNADKECVAYCPDGTPYNSCVKYFVDPCMNHGGSSSAGKPSVTVLSPNGGETYQRGGNGVFMVKWQTQNVSGNQKLDVIRLRSDQNGQEYNLVIGAINDGYEAIALPASVPDGAYTLEIKASVNGTTIMDASDSYFKIFGSDQQPEVSELVKCIFDGSQMSQSCYSGPVGDMAFACSGVGTCVANVSGPKGSNLTWKSTCGGYAYTIIDGDNEYAKFSCGQDSR